MLLRDTLRILVVDDMSTSRGILLQALDALGLTNVSYAEDGKAALRQARQSLPHLVMSDLYMPQMNGLQLLQQLRVDPLTRTVGFILVSGRSDDEVLTTGQKLGMNNFLPKPYSAAELKVSIEAVVGRL
ncbi:response regulator [Jannaschia rubra]|uniref:Chemotaxis protein CheY n=1 Tax=Jannaschia rubra TaxID=282197 RepID=A0A0M6XSJ1_9RHOB|nr:response regulator [Jannaschia rubra]CTQ34060.1 Chemotaxis protein CheY [Jannaschia rubra]SFG24068.1 two-component system, chemotaxis family, response regulator CheY [Jannaschia rubra]